MKLTSLLLILSLFISSCANWERGVSDSFSSVSRLPASTVDEISYYLSVDKFKYYLNEYSVAQEGKIPDPIIAHLRSVTVEQIICAHLVMGARRLAERLGKKMGEAIMKKVSNE